MNTEPKLGAIERQRTCAPLNSHSASQTSDGTDNTTQLGLGDKMDFWDAIFWDLGRWYFFSGVNNLSATVL